MNITLMLEIVRLAASIIQSKTSDKVDDRIDEGLALARIVIVGRQAYEIHMGQPLDESLIKKQERIP